MAASIYSGFYQLAYVTTDHDRAVREFQDKYGVPHFDRFDHALQLDDGGETNIRCALGFVDQLQLEIIQPVGGSDMIYRDALPDDGTYRVRWHHTGFLVDSRDQLDHKRDELEASGHPVALSGRNPGTARFVYLDARATLGHYLEYFCLE